MKKFQRKIKYFSKTWGIYVRPSIAREFTIGKLFDDNLAGLHEIRAQMDKKDYAFKQTAVETA